MGLSTFFSEFEAALSELKIERQK